MFKKAITEVFQWSLKWNLGSFSTAIKSCFFIELGGMGTVAIADKIQSKPIE